MTNSRLISALVESDNEAADDLLLEALRVGNEAEKSIALDALMERETVRGLGGVIGQYGQLSDSLKLIVLRSIKQFHHALRECGRSNDFERRIAAMKLIAMGRQGKLAYVLSENLHDTDEKLSHTACEAMVALARWVATETRSLQKSFADRDSKEIAKTYRELIDNRPEIEAAVARAMDVHRGKHGQELLRASLLLCDWPQSKTLAILHTTKHGGQSPMVRRLQQPPASEQVEAFLLGASHGGLRSHFGIVFSHIDEAPVLDALLRKTHWLKDHQIQLCMHQVTRGTWWFEHDLIRDIERRPPADAAIVAEWLAVSGMHDVMQDSHLSRVLDHVRESLPARLRLLRIAMNRRKGASVTLIRAFLNDPDERLQRMAAREFVRRKPADYENALLQMMTSSPQSVRQVISRAIGQVGFDHFWNHFDRMERATRKQAGRAMLKLLPDALQRLARRLQSGPVEQRIKAMTVASDLDLSVQLRSSIEPLCAHPNAKVRSKAISVLGDVPTVDSDVLLDRVLNDQDARVRANAIEVLEAKRKTEYVPLLAQRARSSHNRERANAIKAMHKMKVGTASTSLLLMLRDDRSEHRISALWALRQIGWWQLINEVGRLAKEDPNLRVRRYAMGVLRNVAEVMQAKKDAGAVRSAG
ncbi:MAG: HEAT repeat domain-containing protein [Anaerolineae bacterium]|nr:HEAT repeat domain-containing protein [Phycisphaerae bacterium]